jgi:putative ABC transport system ATP-binding protein
MRSRSERIAEARLIQFVDVSKVHKQGHREVTALDRVSISIQPQEFVAVMGPSGSGKSTLLHLAGCLDVPTFGEVRIAGKPTTSMPDDELTRLRRTQVGFIFQFFNLIPTLSVLENAELPALLGGASQAIVRQRSKALLAQVGLQDRTTHLPEELSGGEMQRVAIARALINDPPILLADEPTGNLDTVNAHEIMALLASVRQDRTIVMVTHSPEMAAYAGRTLHLKDGRLA